MAVDIGSDAVNRPSITGTNDTFINKTKPASIDGAINSIEIWAASNITGLIVGTFYTTNGNTLKCRDSEAIAGTITAGSKVTKAVSITVETGDYIGCHFSGGNVRLSIQFFSGLWEVDGEYIDPDDEAAYDLNAGWTMSLGGYIEAAVAHEKALSDTISIGDSIVKGVGQPHSDSIAIADAISKKPGLVKTDILSIADSIVLAAEFKRALADTISIADAIVKAMSIPKADTVTIADSISKDFGLVKSDTITISDIFSKAMAYFRSFSDTILMNDSISKAISMIKSDIISIADSIVKILGGGLTIILSDIITITDKVKLAYPVRKAVDISRMTINRLDIGRMTIKRIASARLPYKKIHEEDV